MPATRIAESMKVDRNTVNNDLKILYKKAAREYNSDMTYDDIIQKQLVKLENQRDMLGFYLSDTASKDINNKIPIERLIADIDFKVIGLMERMSQNIIQRSNELIEHVNKIAKDENLQMRYTNLFELERISIETRET